MDSTYFHSQGSSLLEQVGGISEKVGRSQSLFAEIINSVEEYKRTKDCFINSETRYGYNNRYLTITKLIDASTTIKMGEMISGLRSSLDHVIYAFWVSDLSVPYDEKLARDVYFPIADKKSDFEKKLKKLALNDDIGKYIAELQCYPGGTGEWAHSLAKLDNVSKHRAPPVVECTYSVSGIKVLRKGFYPDDQWVEHEVPKKSIVLKSGPETPKLGFSHGMAHGISYLVEEKAEPGVEVDSKNSVIVIDVKFGSPLATQVDALDALSNWLKNVMNIVEKARVIAEARGPTF